MILWYTAYLSKPPSVAMVPAIFYLGQEKEIFISDFECCGI